MPWCTLATVPVQRSDDDGTLYLRITATAAAKAFLTIKTRPIGEVATGTITATTLNATDLTAANAVAGASG